MPSPVFSTSLYLGWEYEEKLVRLASRCRQKGKGTMKTRTAFRRPWSLLVFLWLLLGAIGPVGSWSARADVTIVGSSTILPVVKQAAKLFSEQTGIPVHTKGGGSGAGIKGALARTADIGMVSRALKETEEDRLTSITIGWDGIAVIVNNRNALKGVSHQQVVDIFTGMVTNWRDLGGCDCRIVPVVKRHGRSTRELFDRFFGLGETAPPPRAHTIGSNAEAIVFVAADPMAVGYVSVGSVERARTSGARIRPLALNGISATMVTVVDGSYPLTRPLNLVTAGTPSEEARRFIDFLLGPQGQKVVRDQGFEPVSGGAGGQ